MTSSYFSDKIKRTVGAVKYIKDKGKNYEKIARITSFGTDIGVYINRLRRKGRGNTCTG